ncbi:MAG: ferrochelatase [Campylobacteraceae bacterium 4484_166]|nr:MAG: ferrochelatase [Campylobacteraceae bacterium 4484_166]
MNKAVVLLNMGAARSKDELKEFLTNMFNDKNIVNIKNNKIRSMLANYIIKSRLDEAWIGYKTIGGSSPLYRYTESLVEKLQAILPNIYITYAMRYTKPYAKECIDLIKQKNITEVLLIPLYPQYSTTTTKSSLEQFGILSKSNLKINYIENFYKNKTLNEIISDEIIKRTNGQSDYNLIFSAHGLPQSTINKGDPYQIQTQEHIELIKKCLKEKEATFATISLAYQSKVGPMRWLTPSLSSVLKKFKNQKVLVYPISFMIDNSETIYELCFFYNKVAMKYGCKEYKICSCPNDKKRVVDMIKDMIDQ